MSPAQSFTMMYRPHPHSTALPTSSQASPGRQVPVPSFSGSTQQAQGSSSIPTAAGATFKAPAHKHAHHLHSIPPREKSTRTLILDHMLWIHARTRLRQARAELGMSGIMARQEGSPQIMVHLPPLEDEDPSSDGEHVIVVKFSAQNRQRVIRLPAEDDYAAAQNLSQAQALRLQADGVEKVLTAMVDQPPDIQPPLTDDDTPRAPPLIGGVEEHHYPNGVRFRLSLSTLINDLFARDVPTPLTPTSANTPSMKPRSSSTPATSPILSSAHKHNPPLMSLSSTKGKELEIDTLSNGLPTALAPLSVVSNYSYRDKGTGVDSPLPSISSFTHISNPLNDTLPPILARLPSREAVQQISSNPSTSSSFTAPPPPTNKTRATRATGRVLSLYKSGADPLTANSPPSLRCPRHLHHSCAICAAVKSPPLPTSSHTQPSSTSTGNYSNSSPLSARGAIVFGNNNNGTRSKTPAMSSFPGTGLASWKTGAGIGAGLSKPGIHGTALRRRTISYHTTSHPTAKDAGPCASGCKLADLIPRYLRLSALVAIELGREAKERDEESSEEEEDGNEDGVEDVNEGNDIMTGDNSSSPAKGKQKRRRKSNPDTSFHIPLSSSTSAMRVTLTQDTLNTAFRPTREWYAILSGLLTRAVLEGYLSRGWKGPQGMECLMGVGLGVGVTSVLAAAQQIAQSVTDNSKGIREGFETDDFDHLDPDDFPSLLDAAVILFPTLRWVLRAAQMGLDVVEFESRQKARDGAEGEYEQEMSERLSEFLTVPTSTPDLSTHLEDLAYKFPAEPIERAAVRFCESVTRWRGKPELENYKKQTNWNLNEGVGDQANSNNTNNNNNPAPPKSTIEKYFSRSPSGSSSLVLDRKNPSKRLRSPESANARDGEHASKRQYRLSPPRNDISHVEFLPLVEDDGRGSRDDNDWIGPYGI